MPERVVGSFSVRSVSVLDEKGAVDGSLMPALSDEEIKRSFELMLLSRAFDERALNLQREGRIGTYASVLGQEASQIGSALALEKGDWVFPSFREMAVYITLGYPMHMLYQYWSGDERGMKTPEGLNIFPLCVPVGTQAPHAVGAAWAAKLKGERTAVAVYFGDGGTSKGDFHEAMNIAGVFKLPAVFICQNNQWAISVPRKRQSASETLAQKAVAYGFEGIQVDGNDIFAVYKTVKEALEKARGGGGPTFIECFTYRMSDHTTADDASRYRSKEDVEAWRPRDPLLRLRLFMQAKGLWTEGYEKELTEKSRQAVDIAVKEAESISPQEPKEMFGYTYERPTQRMEKQMKGL